MRPPPGIGRSTSLERNLPFFMVANNVGKISGGNNNSVPKLFFLDVAIPIWLIFRREQMIPTPSWRTESILLLDHFREHWSGIWTRMICKETIWTFSVTKWCLLCQILYSELAIRISKTVYDDLNSQWGFLNYLCFPLNVTDFKNCLSRFFLPQEDTNICAHDICTTCARLCNQAIYSFILRSTSPFWFTFSRCPGSRLGLTENKGESGNKWLFLRFSDIDVFLIHTFYFLTQLPITRITPKGVSMLCNANCVTLLSRFIGCPMLDELSRLQKSDPGDSSR